MTDDPDAEQYRPQLLEIAPGHFVAEFDGMPRPIANSPAERAIA
jgi:hypothetical protein